MKLTLFACGLVIVLISKGALAQPCIQTSAVNIKPAFATAALAHALKSASSRSSCVIDVSSDPKRSGAMQNLIVVIRQEALSRTEAGHVALPRDEAT